MVKTIDFTNNDLSVDANGNIALVDNFEGLRQKINQRLQFFQGEWFLNNQAGVPYYQEILTKPINAGIVAGILNNEILQEPEVTEIREVSTSLDPITREFNYTATVITIYGQMEVTA